MDALGSVVKPCRGGAPVTMGSHSGVFQNHNSKGDPTGPWIRVIACESAYQDEKYGKGNRLHCLQGGKNAGSARCTVCGKGSGPMRP